MKVQNVFILLFFSLTILLLSACTNENSSNAVKDPVQKDFLNYINVSLRPLLKIESEAKRMHESISGKNFKDNATLYDGLKNSVIPKYMEFSHELDNIMPLTNELGNAHLAFMESAHKKLSGFILTLSALEKDDYQILSSANDKVNEGAILQRKWGEMLKEIMEKHNLIIRKEGNTSVASIK